MDKFNIFIILSIILLFGLFIYNLNKDWTGPVGPPGSSPDLKNYKGDFNVSGSINVKGIVKSGDCQLSCTDRSNSVDSSESSSMIIGYIGFGVLILAGISFYVYKNFHHLQDYFLNLVSFD